MANKKSETKKSESSSKKSSVWSLNKLSFWLIVATAVLHLTATILSAIGRALDIGSLGIVTRTVLAVAEAVMICVVGVLGWRYVRNKGTVWIVLYVIVLLVVLVGIVIPLAL